MPPTSRPVAHSAGWNERLVALVAVMLVSLGLLASCAGERPTLGSTAPPRTATSTTVPDGPTETPDPAPSIAPPVAPVAGLGPSDLLGYIATPNGAPVVHEAADDVSPTIDVPAETTFGAPTTFAVVGDPGADQQPWIQVLLPVRPNGTVGWVTRASVTLTKTPFRLFVDLARRTLSVENEGQEVMSTTTAIGTVENPTPPGASYVTELIDNDEPGGAYGPYAFGLSLHSDTLSEFGGGDGQIGVHGTNQPDLIGQAVSHGCVRMTNADVEKLVELQLPLGVPVFVMAG